MLLGNLCLPGQKPPRELREMHAAPLVHRHVRVLQAWTVMRDQCQQIAMVIAPMLGDQPRYPQPAAPWRRVT